jgi:hypothetical protein
VAKRRHLRIFRGIPGHRSAFEAATEEIPSLEESAILYLHEDEYAALQQTPSTAQLESLFGHPQYRYVRARLKAVHTAQINSTFTQGGRDEMPFEKREGIILGIRLALGLPRLLHTEALQRERREEPDEEPLDRSDPGWGEDDPGDLPSTGERG